MIIAHNLFLNFGNQKIFDDVSFILKGFERIGLFGLNGSGKSTLLKAIAGLQKLNDGSITLAKGARVAYLPQEVTLQSDRSIMQETMAAFSDLSAVQAELAQCEAQLALQPGELSLLDTYARLCDQLAFLEPEQKQASAQRILTGLGFAANNFEQSVQQLSVGWKMRIVLAKLLLQNADFYLFDEPTNHLDIVAKEWFLDFLEQSSFGFLLVCHEKRFLNKLCSSIMELERGKATFYTGNYDRYIEQKEEGLARLSAAHEQQERELQKMRESIDRFKAKSSKARMAQSMMKKLDKIERIKLPPASKHIRLAFDAPLKPSRVVFTASDIAHTFGEKQIFKHASFSIERGNKIAIVAANGVGKTTLLNIITARIPLQQGTMTFGNNVTVAVFDQDQASSLNGKRTVFENAYESSRTTTEQKVRSLLGSFLFTNDMINKKTDVLSGGERNRLGMIRVLLQNANFLLLDEPTNHLDIPSKETLLQALQIYEGTILFVSHDQDFVNALATHIIELSPEGTALYHGSYDAYLYQKHHTVSPPRTTSTPSAEPHFAKIVRNDDTERTTIDYVVQKKIRTLEQKIKKLEKDIEQLEFSFADLQYDSEQFKRSFASLQTLKKEHKEMLDEWEQLHV